MSSHQNASLLSSNGKTAFYLIDAKADEIIMELTDGMVLDASFVNGRDLTLAVVPDGDLDTGSVQIDFDEGRTVKTENYPPYALFGDARGDYHSASTMFPEADSYTVDATIFSARSGTGEVLEKISITFGVGTEAVSEDSPAPAEPEPLVVELPEPEPASLMVELPEPEPAPAPVQEPQPAPVATAPVVADELELAASSKTAFYLVDAKADEIIMEITDGMVLDESFVNGRYLTLAVVPDGNLDTGSIYIDFDEGREVKTENDPPYALFGNARGADYYSARNMFPEADSYTVDATIFSGKSGKGEVLEEISITFGVGTEAVSEDSPAPAEPEPLVVELPEPDLAQDAAPEPVQDPAPTPVTTDAPSNAAAGKTAFYLVDAKADEIIMEITDGMVLDESFVNGRYLTLAVVPDGNLDTGSIYIDFDEGREVKTENDPPYALFGNARGADYYSARNMFPEADSYTVDATIFSGKSGKGEVLEEISITFGVGTEAVSEDSPAPAEPEPLVVELPEPEPASLVVEEPAPAPVPAEPAPAPVQEPQPAPVAMAPVVADEQTSSDDNTVPDAEPPVQNGPDPVPADDSAADSGITVAVGSGGQATVVGGRVSTLEHMGDDVASIRILDGADWGNVTVNPDNTMALVLSMEPSKTGPLEFTYEVTRTDGSVETVTQKLNAVAGSQEAGWGDGDFYNLEEGADGNLIVEHGDIHRKVYVSGSDDALSLEDIAALEGISLHEVKGYWLEDHPEYGGSPDMALTEEAAGKIWTHLLHDGKPNSHHLLFERGYEYEPMPLLGRHAVGESELHPIYIGAYGEGDKPLIDFKVTILHGGAHNVVVQGLEIDDSFAIYAESSNIIFDDMSFSSDIGYPIAAAFVDGLTIRNSDFIDVIRTVDPVAMGDGMWSTGENRMQSIYVDNSTSVLMEDLFIDHTGWADDYTGLLEDGQPPNMFSQNIYIQHTNEDVTLRDTITMRAASYGAQMRSGGFVENVVFLDNNAGFIAFGGNYGIYEPKANYTLMLDSVVTSAAHKEAFAIGATAWGAAIDGFDSSLVGNIITHAVDPNNPAEFEYKTGGDNPLQLGTDDPYYNDTIIHNWYTAHLLANDRHEIYRPSENIDGLDEDVLDQTTIQNFTADHLGTSLATIEDFATYQELAYDGDIDGAPVTADDIVEYFQNGFGFTPDDDTPTIMRFIPDDRGEGLRWDNSLNWSGDEHVKDGDSVDLAGNWVRFDGTLDLDTLDFGDGGTLVVDHGKLTVDDMESDGDSTLLVDDAGQIWTGGASNDGKLTVEVEGGRFANTGKFDGLFDLIARDGQTLLGVDGAHTEVQDGSTLSVEGSEAKVGFDGTYNGVSVLEIGEGGTLSMTADENGFSTIEEFRSGAFDQDTPKVLSAFDMGDGALLLDVTTLQGKSVTETLIEVDEMVGSFDEINIVGLGSDQDATLTFDYETDTVTLDIATGGKGGINIVREGYDDDMDETVSNAAIWNVLTEGNGVYEELEDDEIEVNGSEYDEDDLAA